MGGRMRRDMGPGASRGHCCGGERHRGPTDVDDVLALLEERQRDLEQAAADIAEEIRRLRTEA